MVLVLRPDHATKNLPGVVEQVKGRAVDPACDPKAAAGLGDADMTPALGGYRHCPLLSTLQVRDAQAGAGQGPNPEPIRSGDQEALSGGRRHHRRAVVEAIV